MVGDPGRQLSSGSVELHGHCDRDFGAVADAFRANFEQGVEVGASVAVTLDGHPVVDLWAGDAADGSGDQARTPWSEDTIVNVFSTTKTVAALCLWMLADRGQLDWDAPVADYWPEFATSGKEGVLVRHVMGHTSGLSGWDEPVTVDDLFAGTRSADLLAAQAPWWEPGTQSGYHAITLGSLQGELVRRIDGRTLGTFCREEITGPLDADFHIGFGPEHDHRCGELVPPAIPLDSIDTPGPDTIAQRTLGNPVLDGTEPRRREWRAAEIPAAGGFGNARSVARIHAATACGGEVDGVRLLSADGLDAIFREQYQGDDLVSGLPVRMGMGVGLPIPAMGLPNPRTCFWGGWGGSLAVIDLDARMSFAYVMNRMHGRLEGDLRAMMLVAATYGSLRGIDR